MAKKISLKQKFLKKWLNGLQIYSSSKNLTTVTERRKFIKLSADIAVASARDGVTKWSRSVIANASRDSKNKSLIEQISGCGMDILRKSATKDGRACHTLRYSVAKKILKRSRRTRKSEPMHSRLLPGSITKQSVKKRTRVLKELVPGGESMDDESLFKETLDYIMSLRAQVDVMRSLACMSEHLNRK